MDQINYKHLRYFSYVAKEGSITAASERLHLTPQTISAQLRLLEESLGVTLFERGGRALVLTEAGRQTLEYADKIFSLGAELRESLLRKQQHQQLVFNVGISDVVPKLIAYRLLEPALRLEESVKICCHESTQDALLADLAIHKLDMVITDRPLESRLHVRAFNHFLGECSISFFASPSLARQYRPAFPQSLDGAPLLLPASGTDVHAAISDWLQQLAVEPRMVGEFADSALMKTFGQAGVGIFSAPSVIAREVNQQYGVEVIGSTSQVGERFYAITTERHVRHPAAQAVCHQARTQLFEQPDSVDT